MFAQYVCYNYLSTQMIDNIYYIGMGALMCEISDGHRIYLSCLLFCRIYPHAGTRKVENPFSIEYRAF